MTSSDAKFICTVDDSTEMKVAVGILNETQKSANEKLEFLKKQAENMRNEVQACWKNIWDVGVRTGKIDPTLDFDKWHIFLIDNGRQIFIDKCDHGHPFIQQIIMGDGP